MRKLEVGEGKKEGLIGAVEVNPGGEGVRTGGGFLWNIVGQPEEGVLVRGVFREDIGLG